jgi:integrase
VKQSRPELRFLTERELETAVRLAKRHGDVLAFAAGTGLRFGEISALWVGDVDLDRGTVRVNKAWKRNGEDDATETPGWLSRQLQAKHRMRDHHLGHPKTPRSRRTITIAPTVADLLEKRIKGRPTDDFVFTSRTGRPLHNGDFYTHVWRKLMAAVVRGARAVSVPRSAAHPRGVVDRRRCSAAAHPGQAWSRVDHHDDRYVRSPVDRGR